MAGCSTSFASNDSGSALVVALVAVTLALTLAGSLVLYSSARLALVRYEVYRVEADYAAESAAFAAIARLAEQPDWRPVDESISLAAGAGSADFRTIVSVRARGLLLDLVVTTTRDAGRPVSSVTTLVTGRADRGELPAIAFGDTLSSLTLSAGASVRGTIQAGPRGVETAPLGGRPFTGRVEGAYEVVSGPPLPPYDNGPAAETLLRQRRDLGALPDSLPPVLARAGPAHPAWADERRYNPDAVVRWIGAGARLGPADSSDVRGTTHLLAAGDLRLDGPLRLRPWTTLFVRGHLTVSGSVEAENLLVVAEDVTVTGPARLQGQILARRSLEVDGGSRFAYPSVLYGAAEPLGEGDAVTVGRAEVDGAVFVPPGTDDPERVRLTLSPEALVRGLVYSGRTADVRGRVEGTLAVARTRFYDSPAVYVNWIRDLVVDREARPASLVLPFGFGDDPPAPAVVAQRRWSWTGDREGAAP